MSASLRSLSTVSESDHSVDCSTLPDGPSWISTPTSELILAGLRYAHLANDIVVIYGGAGLGKTASILRYKSISNNVFHAQMSPSTRGLKSSLEEIAAAIGLEDETGCPGYLNRGICKQLRAGDGLLVIDEAHELGVSALDQIRCIHDRTKVGIALVGNERVYTQLAGAGRAAYLDRLYSRIGKRIHLSRSTHEDADAIATAWGIEERTSRVCIREIASKPGGLRVLTKVLRLASAYAGTGTGEIGADDLRLAWQNLGGLG